MIFLLKRLSFAGFSERKFGGIAKQGGVRRYYKFFVVKPNLCVPKIRSIIVRAKRDKKLLQFFCVPYANVLQISFSPPSKHELLTNYRRIINELLTNYRCDHTVLLPYSYRTRSVFPTEREERLPPRKEIITMNREP